MLVLNRYRRQMIRINDDIVIKVLGVNDDVIRLGIDAPAEVRVHREEIYQKIQSQEAKHDH